MIRNESSALSRIAYRLTILVLVSFILIYAQSLLIPLAWALVISLASMRLVTRIHERTHLPYSLTIILFILGLLLIFGAVIFFFYLELLGLLSDLGLMQEKLSLVMHDLSLKLKGMGVDVPDHFDPVYFKGIVSQHNDMVIGLISSVGVNLWNVLLTLFYVFFLLYYKDSLLLFARRRFKEEAAYLKFRKIVTDTLGISQQYIAGMGILGLITSVMSYLTFLLLGIKSALFFAVFFGFLSLIPVVGVPVGVVIIAFFTLLTKDSALSTLYVVVALILLNFLQDNVFRPMVMGTKMEVNAFAIFFFVIAGGFFWGVSGMILFIPLASIIKILLDHSEHGSHYTVFLTELPKKEKKQKIKSAKEL
jgi:predicted PurR-regulated permease PerM